LKRTISANVIANEVLPVLYKASTANVNSAISTRACIKGFNGIIALGDPKILHSPMISNGSAIPHKN